MIKKILQLLILRDGNLKQRNILREKKDFKKERYFNTYDNKSNQKVLNIA